MWDNHLTGAGCRQRQAAMMSCRVQFVEPQACLIWLDGPVWYQQTLSAMVVAPSNYNPAGASIREICKTCRSWSQDASQACTVSWWFRVVSRLRPQTAKQLPLKTDLAKPQVSAAVLGFYEVQIVAQRASAFSCSSKQIVCAGGCCGECECLQFWARTHAWLWWIH